LLRKILNLFNICDQLYDNNYNTDIIDTLPDKVQEMWKKYSYIAYNKLVSISEKGVNQPLAVSVVNHFAGNQPVVGKISGIGRITYMTNGDKKIYIFDDLTHSYEYACVPEGETIITYLNWIFKTADRFIDFYCEYEPIIRSKVSAYLGTVEQTFRSCTTGNQHELLKHDCPANVRIHFIDVRQMGVARLNEFLIKSSKYWDWSNHEIDLYSKKINEYRHAISNKDNYDAFIFFHINNNSYVMKELNRLDINIRDNVVDYFFTHAYTPVMNYVNRKGTTALNKMEKAIKTHTKLSDADFDDYWNICAIGYAFIMDIYFLCRMLKKYDVTKSVNHPEYAKNIIVYAGSAHTKVYIDYLSKNGYTTIYKKSFSDSKLTLSCLDMMDMPQPLFTNKYKIYLSPKKYIVTENVDISKKAKIEGPRKIIISKRDQYKIGNDIFFRINMDGVTYTDFYVDIPKNTVKELKLMARYAYLTRYSTMKRDELLTLVEDSFEFS
jgi:hypothetical protein